MYNVVIFGTGSGCKRVKSILNSKLVKIVVYSDNNKLKQDKIIDDIHVVDPKSIIKYNYDYIIIASEYFDSISKQLLSLGINKEKILCFYDEYTKFQNFYFKMLLFDKMFTNKSIETLITGMSYAECGINADILKSKAFNFGASSQDLFYDYNIVKYLFQSKLENVKNLKYAIIDLCYFSFEYDMSRSRTKSNIFRYQKLIKNIHNWNEDKFSEEYKKIINRLKVYNDLIDDKKIFQNVEYLVDSANKSTKKINDFVGTNDYFSWINYEENLNGSARIQAIKETKKHYPETVKENKYIFAKYLKLLMENDVQPIVVVLPTHRLYSSNYPQFMKKSFYDIISEFKSIYNFQFLDYFDSKIFNSDDFMDLVHLNSFGAKKMTEILNKAIL